MKSNKFKKLLTPQWWMNKFTKYFFYKSGISDIRDYLLIRRKHPQIPKTKFIWGGTKMNSLTFYNWALGDLEIFKEYGKLTPSFNVLDVGCGIGRLAYIFDNYLKSGKYYGFDANFNSIQFDKKNYKSHKLNFTHVDVENSFL